MSVNNKKPLVCEESKSHLFSKIAQYCKKSKSTVDTKPLNVDKH